MPGVLLEGENFLWNTEWRRWTQMNLDEGQGSHFVRRPKNISTGERSTEPLQENRSEVTRHIWDSAGAGEQEAGCSGDGTPADSWITGRIRARARLESHRDETQRLCGNQRYHSTLIARTAAVSLKVQLAINQDVCFSLTPRGDSFSHADSWDLMCPGLEVSAV